MGEMSSKAEYEVKAGCGIGPRSIHGNPALPEEPVPGGSYRPLQFDDHVQYSADTSPMKKVTNMQSSSANAAPADTTTDAIADTTNGNPVRHADVLDTIAEGTDEPPTQKAPGDGEKKRQLVCITEKPYTPPKRLSLDTIRIYETSKDKNDQISFTLFRTPPSDKMKAKISMFERENIKPMKRSFSDIGGVPQASVKKLISKFEYHTQRPTKTPKLGHQFMEAFSEAKADVKNMSIDTLELKACSLNTFGEGDLVFLKTFVKTLIEAKHSIFDRKIKNTEIMNEELSKWKELIDTHKRNGSFDRLKADIVNLVKAEDLEKVLTLLRDMVIISNRIENLHNLIRERGFK